MDNQDELDGIDNDSKKTIIELVFYYICAEENNQLQSNTEDTSKKNFERYPIREVSSDMFNFIVSLHHLMLIDHSQKCFY